MSSLFSGICKTCFEPVQPQELARGFDIFDVETRDYTFSHTFVEKIGKSMNLLPVCKLYPTLLALLSHTASSVANAG